MPRSSVSVLFVVVAIVCILALVAMLVAPNTPFWGAAPSGPTVAATDTAKAFLEDLAAGRISQATARTTAQFQQANPPATLAALAGKTPALQKLTDVRFETIASLGSQMTLSGSTNGYMGSARVTVTLVQGDGGWLVDSVQFP